MKNLSSQNVVRCEEKEDRILDFLGYYFEMLSDADNNRLFEKSVTLIARSPSSPVARALYAFVSETPADEINVRIIFSQLDPTDTLSNWFDLIVDQSEKLNRPEIRWAKTPSLTDAHEQLVLGSMMSWSGDSMRREPSKRDAFELYRSACEQSAEYGLRAFNMIWDVSQAVPVRLTGNLTKRTNSVGSNGENAIFDKNSQSTTGTRH